MNTTLPNSFDELIRTSATPVLVDFWADWCAPCKTLAPTLQQIARHFGSSLTVIKINVDEKPHIAAAYAIQSIPTLILFRDGKIAWQQSGALPFDALRNSVERFIG